MIFTVTVKECCTEPGTDFGTDFCSLHGENPVLPAGHLKRKKGEKGRKKSEAQDEKGKEEKSFHHRRDYYLDISTLVPYFTILELNCCHLLKIVTLF